MALAEKTLDHRAAFLKMLDGAATRAEWRGSEEGLEWSQWAQMTSPVMTVPCYALYQVRILIRGKWCMSPIGTATHPSEQCPKCKLRAHQLTYLR